ncbi:MAG: hypothetical protein JNK05_11670 [Myxococcales bacterium]|nr:hypothetical protein [Myxococcales bacterium]
MQTQSRTPVLFFYDGDERISLKPLNEWCALHKERGLAVLGPSRWQELAGDSVDVSDAVQLFDSFRFSPEERIDLDSKAATFPVFADGRGLAIMLPEVIVSFRKQRKEQVLSSMRRLSLPATKVLLADEQNIVLSVDSHRSIDALTIANAISERISKIVAVPNFLRLSRGRVDSHTRLSEDGEQIP